MAHSASKDTFPEGNHSAMDEVLVLESNAAFRLDGVGYRGLGNLRDVGLQPPAQWWTRNEVWTWRRICSTYSFRRQAWLKVKERSALVSKHQAS